MRTNLLLLLIIILPFAGYAQDWETNTSNDIYYDQGNVGIGTDNPSKKLEIVGDNNTLRIWKGSGNSPLEIRSDGDGTHNNSPILISSYGYGGSQDLIYRIGNWSGNYYYRFGSTGGSFNALKITKGGGNGDGPNTGYGILDIYSLNQEIGIRFNGNGDSYFNTGKVGIGITTPNSLLHIKQGSSGGTPHDFSKLTIEHSSNAMISVLTPNSSKGYFGFADTDDDFVGGMYYSHSSNVLGFRVNDQNDPSLEIRSDGNVGIGVSNAKYKLTVQGVISASEVRVNSTPNSDYVFESDYNLLPITEVETFIKENKHLPEIPSAEEFKENGVGLGEMDDMLLRKIEELTLYVIELKKENEELKSNNELLLNRVEKLENK